MDSCPTLSILLFLMLFTTSLFSQTIIPGQSNYPSNVWTKENSPYIIEGPLGLGSSSTLIIQPGVVVKFMKNAQLSINDNRKLFALGTAEEKITFTSAEEDPIPGDWNSLYLFDSENNVKLRHCIIEYGRNGIFIQSELSVSTFATQCPDENSYPVIENCVIRFCQDDGIKCEAVTDEDGLCTFAPIPDAVPTISNCEIYSNGNHGINLIAGVRGRVSGTISNNRIYDNQGDGISTTLSASGYCIQKSKATLL